MWHLYNYLIQHIPEDIYVKDFMLGVEYTYIEIESSVGIAKTLPGSRFPFTIDPFIGMSLKKLAASIKSFNYIESSLALAALNSYYNSNQGLLSFKNISNSISLTTVSNDYFKETILPRMHQGDFSLVGHYPYFEEQIPSIFEYTVFDENPVEGDYPITACEYILPTKKNIWLNGSSLIKKRLPRLLDICPDSYITLFDLDITLHPILLEKNQGELVSLLVNDKEQCKYLIKSGATTEKIFRTGELTCLKTII